MVDKELYITYNPSNSTSHKANYNLSESYNYGSQKINFFVHYGWMYIAVNFKSYSLTNTSRVWAFGACHDQCRIVTNIFKMKGNFVDDNNYIWCLGGSSLNYNGTAGINKGLMALVNNWYVVKGEVIERWNAMDAFGFQ